MCSTAYIYIYIYQWHKGGFAEVKMVVLEGDFVVNVTGGNVIGAT
jgi:hypothetical protein